MEGESPRGITPTNAKRFFRVISRWGKRAYLIEANSEMGVAELNGKIYVVGGRLQAEFTSGMTNILEVFDPATSQWSTRAPTPTTRGGINGTAANGYFFVFGGEGPDGVIDEKEMYVPVKHRWYQLGPLPIAVHSVTGSAFVNCWIHLPGGGKSTDGSSGASVHQVFWEDVIHP